jgi:proline dehydrogenase
LAAKTLEAKRPSLQKNWNEYGVQTIFGLWRGAKEGEENFDHARDVFIRVIEYAAYSSNIPYISVKITGIARFELLQTLNSAPRLRM